MNKPSRYLALALAVLPAGLMAEERPTLFSFPKEHTSFLEYRLSEHCKIVRNKIIYRHGNTKTAFKIGKKRLGFQLTLPLR